MINMTNGLLASIEKSFTTLAFSARPDERNATQDLIRFREEFCQ